jgi:hypothetical protein
MRHDECATLSSEKENRFDEFQRRVFFICYHPLCDLFCVCFSSVISARFLGAMIDAFHARNFDERTIGWKNNKALSDTYGGAFPAEGWAI